MPLVLKLAKADFEFLAEKVPGLVRRNVDQVADGEEAGLLINNYTGIRGDADLAVCELEEGRNGVLGRDGRGQVD